MTHYYNEIDPYCAAWLQNLMDAGHIPQGVIDTRSIEDVRPNELAGFVQCHFFAGISGWPVALALAGWPSDRPVWTGSCPCQPFSAAGKGAGFADQRHLWPAWFHLIAQCRPSTLFGEQVAAAVGHAWLDGVCADLEGQGYAVGAAILPACAAGAPHRRDRLWFGARLVDHADHTRLEGFGGHDGDTTGWQEPSRSIAATGRGSVVADADSIGGKVDPHAGRSTHRSGAREVTRSMRAGDGPLADTAIECSRSESETVQARKSEPRGNDHRALAHTGTGRRSDSELRAGRDESRVRSAWDNHAWIIGHDGKARRVEPDIRLLAHGIPVRVGRLRAYGNAIVPEIAAEFIQAYAESIEMNLEQPELAA